MKSKGITLISLVVTIIVLLILAGVSLKLVVGNDGILRKATKAVSKYQQAAIQEEIELEISQIVADYYQNEELALNYPIVGDYIKEKLHGHVISTGSEIKYNASKDEFSFKIEEKEVTFQIDQNGKITNLKFPESISGGGSELEEDTIAPAISILGTTTNSITFYATDAIGVVAYAITQTNQEPTQWEEVTSTQELEKTITELTNNQTYYIWVKDQAGNRSEAQKVVTSNFEKLEHTISWTNTIANITITAPTSGVKYRIDSMTDWRDYKESVAIESGKTVQFIVTDGTNTTEIVSIIPRVQSQLIYDINGGTGNVPEGSRHLHQDNVTVSFATKPTKTGFIFDGWSRNPNASNAEYTEAGTKTFSMPAEPVTLYAIWVPNTGTPYKVIHRQMNVTGSGYTVVETQNLTGTTGESITPTVKAYTGFTAPATQTKTILADGSTTITYDYTRNQYTFTLGNVNGVSTSGSSTTGRYYYGATLTLKASVDSNYVWNKWTGSASSFSTTTAETTIIMPAYNLTMTPSVYAPYIISYSANGGSGAPSSQIKKYGVTLTLSSTKPTRNGYTFLGWSTQNNATSAMYTAGGAYTTNANATLYAVWEQITYDLSYNANTGTGTVPASVKYAAGNTVTVNFTSKPSKTGYIFVGWSKNQNATTAEYTEAGTKTFSMPAEPVTLYAIWVPNTGTPYKVIHRQMNVTGSGYTVVETQNLTGTTGESITPTVKAYTGFTAPATQTKTIVADGSTTITYDYTRNQYKFTLGSVTGVSTTGSSATGNYYYGATITLKASVNLGYVWNKWTGSNSSFSTTTANTTLTMPAYALTMTPSVLDSRSLEYTTSWSGSTATITVTRPTSGVKYRIGSTGTWNNYTTAVSTASGTTVQFIITDGITSTEAVSVTPRLKSNVSYDKNGGTGSVPATIQYTHEDNVTISFSIKPTKTGYTFHGWSKNRNATTAEYIETGTKTFKMPAEAVTLYAIWVPNAGTAYKVVHRQMNVTGSGYTVVETQNLTGTTGASITPSVRTYTGFTSPSTQTTTISANGSTTVTYDYTRNQYSFTLGTCDGVNTTGSSTTGNYYYGATITLKATVSTDYIWDKWIGSSSNFTTTTANSTFTMPNYNLTMTPNAFASYTITYDANGGSGAPSSQKKKAGEILTLSSTKPTKEGYTFLGWAGDRNSTMPAYAPGDQFIIGKTRTLYAIWGSSSYQQKVGDKVNYTVTIEDTTFSEWRIMYGDENTVTMICQDYVPNKLSLIEEAGLQAFAENDYGVGSPEVWAKNRKDLIDKLTNTNLWKGLLTDKLKASGATAQGAVDLETFVSSFRAKSYSDTVTTTTEIADDGLTGYYLSKPSNANFTSLNCTNSSMYNDELYFPDKTTDKAERYRLSSASIIKTANGNRCTWTVGADGKLNCWTADPGNIALRPIITLPTNFLTEKENGGWKIVTPKVFPQYELTVEGHETLQCKITSDNQIAMTPSWISWEEGSDTLKAGVVKIKLVNSKEEILASSYVAWGVNKEEQIATIKIPDTFVEYKSDEEMFIRINVLRSAGTSVITGEIPILICFDWGESDIILKGFSPD